ncbi:MAG: hypothetical protein GEU82_09435 [Luteitalea sp.]|nr:hypothetical protein [Luteitalea sp.]
MSSGLGAGSPLGWLCANTIVAAFARSAVEWSVRSERSFTWWPKDFAETVSVTSPVESRGLQVCRLTASTPMAVQDAAAQEMTALLWRAPGQSTS